MSTSGSHPTREEGLRLIKEGSYDEAIRILDMVVETDPSDAQALLYLGVAYAESGKKAEAIAALEQCVGVKPSARAHYNLGLAYESVDRLGEAMVQYENAARHDPNYKSAVDAVERLKQKGVQPRESEVQWTIGAQSVGDMIAQQQTQQQTQQMTQQMAPPTDQTTSVPPAYTPGNLQAHLQGQKQSQSGPTPYLPGQYEAEQEAKLRAHQMQLTKSGLIYGIIVGPIGLAAGFFMLYIFFGMAALNIPLTLIVGVFAGAILGALCGYTGGGEETGQRAGALLFGLFGLMSGLLKYSQIGMAWFLIQVAIYAALGFVVGMFIGRMVNASIGWD